MSYFLGTFLGNFTPKTSNYCLKDRALGFPGKYIIHSDFLAYPNLAPKNTLNIYRQKHHIYIYIYMCVSILTSPPKLPIFVGKYTIHCNVMFGYPKFGGQNIRFVPGVLACRGGPRGPICHLVLHDLFENPGGTSPETRNLIQN